MNACRKSGNRKEILLICYICLVCHVFVTHQKNRAVGLLSCSPKSRSSHCPFRECCAEVWTSLCSLAAHLTKKGAWLGQTDKQAPSPFMQSPGKEAEGWDLPQSTAVQGVVRDPLIPRVVCRSLRSELWVYSLQTFISHSENYWNLAKHKRIPFKSTPRLTLIYQGKAGSKDGI